MAEISLVVKKREISTKGALNKLRREGEVPGVYYLKGKDPVSFSVEEIAINPLHFDCLKYYKHYLFKINM